jgi:hypothetical protein
MHRKTIQLVEATAPGSEMPAVRIRQRPAFSMDMPVLSASDRKGTPAGQKPFSQGE